MKKGLLIIGVLMVLPFIILVIMVDDSGTDIEIVKCYDNKANEIIGLECYNEVYNLLPGDWNMLVPIFGIIMVMGALFIIGGVLHSIM